MKELLDFRNHLIESEKSELTVEKYLRDVRRFLVWLRGGEVTKSRVLEYKGELIEGYAIASANSMLSSVNCYLAFIGCGDCQVKTIRQQRRVFLPEEKELSRQEYENLLKAAQSKPRLCLLMQTICSTGIRVSEHMLKSPPEHPSRRGFSIIPHLRSTNLQFDRPCADRQKVNWPLLQHAAVASFLYKENHSLGRWMCFS